MSVEKKQFGGILKAVTSLAGKIPGVGESAGDLIGTLGGAAGDLMGNAKTSGQAPVAGELNINGTTYVPKGDAGIKVGKKPELPGIGTNLTKGIRLSSDARMRYDDKPVDTLGARDMPDSSLDTSGIEINREFSSGTPKGDMNTAKKKGLFNTASRKGDMNTVGDSDGIMPMGTPDVLNKISVRPLINHLFNKPIKTPVPKIPMMKYTPGRVSPVKGLSYDQIAQAKQTFAEMTGPRSPVSSSATQEIFRTIGRDGAVAANNQNILNADIGERARTEGIQLQQEAGNHDRGIQVEAANLQSRYMNRLQEARNSMMEKQLEQQRSGDLVKGLYSDMMRKEEAIENANAMQRHMEYGTMLKMYADDYSHKANTLGVNHPETIAALQKYKNAPVEQQSINAEAYKKAQSMGTLGPIIKGLFKR